MKLSTNGVVEFSKYDFTVDGKCSNCGECCSDLLTLTAKEIAVIRKYIAKHNIKEQKNLPIVLRNSLDMTCPFRDEANRKCLIYEVRPLICQAYMCCHTKDDILANSPKLCREKRHNVFMRKEFYNSDEDLEFRKHFLTFVGG